MNSNNPKHDAALARFARALDEASEERIRYLTGTMPEEERAGYNAAFDPDSEAKQRLAAQERVCQKLLQPEAVAKFMASLRKEADVKRDPPVPTPVQSTSLGMWLQETLDKISADVTKAFNDAVSNLLAVQGRAATDGTVQVPTDKLVVVFQSLANERQIRILAEIEDIALEGQVLAATWRGEQVFATLKRPSETSSIVTAEILLGAEQARFASEQGIRLRLAIAPPTDDPE
jgi:hypothetical protein